MPVSPGARPNASQTASFGAPPRAAFRLPMDGGAETFPNGTLGSNKQFAEIVSEGASEIIGISVARYARSAGEGIRSARPDHSSLLVAAPITGLSLCGQAPKSDRKPRHRDGHAGSNDRRYNARDLGDAGGRRIGGRHVGNDRPDTQVRRSVGATIRKRSLSAEHIALFTAFLIRLRCLSENGSLAAATENAAGSIRRVFAPRTSALLMLTCDFVRSPSDGVRLS